MVTAVVILLAVFFGIAVIIATTGVVILLGQGKLTLPNTNQRSVMRERANLTLDQIRLERDEVNMKIHRLLEAGKEQNGS